jgi:hypothetical protein
MNTVASLPANVAALQELLIGVELDAAHDPSGHAKIAALNAAIAALTPAGEGGLPEEVRESRRTYEVALRDCSPNPIGPEAAVWNALSSAHTAIDALIRRLATTEQPGSSVQGEAALYEAAAKGFHTSESCGTEGRYLHKIAFRSLEELQTYEREWTRFMVAVRDTTPPPAPAAEQGHTASGVFAEYPDATDRATFLYFNGDGDVPVGQEVLIHLKDAQPEARGVEGMVAEMRNFADVADRCQLTEGNAPAAIMKTTFYLRLPDDDITKQNLLSMGTLEAALDHPDNTLPPEYFFFADKLPVGATVLVTLELVRPNNGIKPSA